jgi:hypothetical protein
MRIVIAFSRDVWCVAVHGTAGRGSKVLVPCRYVERKPAMVPVPCIEECRIVVEEEDEASEYVQSRVGAARASVGAD